MSLVATIAAMTIAFPQEGQKLPYLERVYMIGAAPRGVTNVVVQSRNVPVYRTGAWGTLVDAVEGSNTVEISFGGAVARRSFFVAKKPAPPPAGTLGAPPAEKVWEKLDYCSDVPVPHPNGKKPSETLVCIDPGHGGSDTGALSPHAFLEKDANLLQAKALEKELLSRGYKVFMTREDDRALVLKDRPREAVERKADAFVSIHHNAPGPSQDPIQSRHCAVYSWNAIGERLSNPVAARLAEALDGEVPSKGSLHANFAVTRNPQIPSILVEVDFMTHPEGEEAIFDHIRRAWVARAIADGISDWAAGKNESREEQCLK